MHIQIRSNTHRPRGCGAGTCRGGHAAAQRDGARDLIAPGSGAVVMGTGIVSIALALDGLPSLSRALLGLDGACWIVLAAVAGLRLAHRRSRFLLEARSPAGLTGVAGTAVLGSRLLDLGWTDPAVALLVIGLIAWLALMVLIAPRLPARGSGMGQVFMLTVAAESLAGLAAGLAVSLRAPWLVYLALALAGLGLAAYPIGLARFCRYELVRGRGDQWVAGGSLAICSLTVAQIAMAAARLGTPAGAVPALDDISLGLWAGGAVWIAPLLLGEVHRPRAAYHSRRWATVFPLGMYSASAFSVAAVTGVDGLAEFAWIWVWLAFAAWAAAVLGMTRRGLNELRSGPSSGFLQG
jgi:tellurite resistance protein TehA-like permease